MAAGYAVVVILLASGTILALSPIRRPRAARGATFVFGLALNELPFLTAFILIVATFLALFAGALDSTAGGLLAAVAALTVAGQVLVVRRALRARPAVQEALDAELGEDWRERLQPEMVGGSRARTLLSKVLSAPAFVVRRGVKRVRDLSYGDAGEENLLDVYHRQAGGSSGPVLVFLHGGGFRRGKKSRESKALFYRLTGQGWICITANYRLRPDATFEDHVIDSKKVIAWARLHAADYGAAADSIFSAGSSAGAHLAAMVALTPNRPEFQPGFEDADTSVSGAICLSGYYGSYFSRPGGGEGRPNSPADFINGQSPPFFIAHGDLDNIVPVRNVRRFVTSLRDPAGAPVIYAELPGGQHSFDLWYSLRYEAVIDGIEAFTAWVREHQVE